MTFKLKLSSQNQITLPGELLSQMEVKSGQFIEIIKINGQFIIRTFRDVLRDLDRLSIDIQKKTKIIQKSNPSLTLDDLIQESTQDFYSKQL